MDLKELPVHHSNSSRRQLETASWFAVVRTYLECSKRYTQMLQNFDLTVAQYDVLRAIESLGEDAVPKTIADRLIVTRANITGLLRRLEQRGLVKMRAHRDDGRSLICSLTRTGRALHDQAHEAADRFVRAQLKPFSSHSLRDMEAMMHEMQAHLQSLDPDALAFPGKPGASAHI